MFGATVGRNVNRISNARFEIDGKEYYVAKNRGKHNIHSDKEHGFHKVLWDSEIIDDHAVKFTYVSPDGEQGFPGTLVTKYHLYGNGNKWIDRFLSCSQR